MSSTRVKQFKRTLDYTATFTAPSTVTFVTSSVHRLVTGNLVDIIDLSGTTQLVNQSVIVVDNVTFTISTSDTYWESGKIVIHYFSTGITGFQSMTLPRSVGVSTVVQSHVVGTGAASYVLNGSLDGIHWSVLATITHSATSGDTQFLAIEPAWVYIGANITSIGAATTLAILASA